MATQTSQLDLDLKAPLATLIPLRVAPGLSLNRDSALRVQFVLEHDSERLPLNVPYPWFGIFDEKGALVLRTNFVTGETGWTIENPAAGRIGYLVDGQNSAFAVLNSNNPVMLEWRLIGIFNSQTPREITTAKGEFLYDPLGAEGIVPTPPDNLGDCCDQLGLEIQYELDNQYYYTEYQWDPTTGLLVAKRHYDSVAKNDHLFTITYTWGPSELLERKRVLRHRDGVVLQLDYTWSDRDGTPTSETLLSVTRSAGS